MTTSLNPKKKTIMNFNKERFANFATYDLTINKSFYRNMAFVTIAGSLCIALIGFIARYSMYNSILDGGMSGPAFSYTPEADSIEGYNWMYFTSMYELGFFLIMLEIFAGCWAHNLRNKQGRITELTLPATNLEKFTWHALLMLTGGLILCIVALLIADGLNALLTLITYGTENGVTSLTASVFEMCSYKNIINTVFLRGLSHGMSPMHAEDNPANPFFDAFSVFLFSTIFCHIMIYALGNAFKYKYNIILTYVALQVIGTILSVLFFICIAAGAANMPTMMDMASLSEEDAIQAATITFYVLAVVVFAIAAFFLWWSYNRYTKAQITSSFNK
jgi:hypothetical protein